MNEQFEKKINESELREVKLDSGPLLQRKNAAWEIKEDLIRREEALEIIRTSDVWYAYTEKTPHDADTAFNFMKREIKDLPSVQPKPKIGWCPNCGVRMFEPQESEDKE